MEFQNTNLKVLVGNAVTFATETTLPTFKTSGSAGEFTATDASGAAIVTGSERVVIASKKTNGKLDLTESLKITSIKSIKASAYDAATERIEYVGFNGSTGSVEIKNNFLYQVNFDLENFGSLSAENTYFRTAQTMSSSSTNQAEVVDGLLGSAIRNVSREPYRLLFEMVLNDAGAVITGTGNLTFEKGSKLVSAATDADAVVAVGDYLRAGTAIDSPVYRIVAIDTTANVIELSTPYLGESGVVTEASAQYIAAATAATADAGLRITGVEQDFVPGKLKFQKVDWRTTVVEFEADTTLIQAAYLGNGEGARVAELEWFAAGNFGDEYKMGEPNLYPTSYEAVASGKYDTLAIEFTHLEDGFVGTTSPRQLLIFASAGADGTDHTAINGVIGKLNTAAGITITAL